MKINIIAENCAGEGICEQEAPELFEIVDGLAVAKVDEVPADQQEAARSACANCPTEAIELTD